jgi:hypothetical protein
MDIDGDAHHLRIANLVDGGMAAFDEKTKVQMKVAPSDQPDGPDLISLDKTDYIVLGVRDRQKAPQTFAENLDAQFVGKVSKSIFSEIHDAGAGKMKPVVSETSVIIRRRKLFLLVIVINI